MILSAVHLTVEVVCVAFLAAFVLFAVAALVEGGARADRALVDVETARAREVPVQLGVEHCDPDWDQGAWDAVRRDWERDLIEREPYDWAGEGL